VAQAASQSQHPLRRQPVRPVLPVCGRGPSVSESMGLAKSKAKTEDDPPRRDLPQYQFDKDGNPLTKDQQVHAAACNGDVQMLEELAAEGVDLNKPRDPDGLLPIDACAWSGCTSGVMALLRLGASASKSVQAVAGAAAWGHPELLEALLAAGGPVDQDFSNSTPLRWAVEMSHEDCAEILVRYGAWKAEPEQDAVLGRARRKRLRSLLDAIAQVDPARAPDCVVVPCWKSCEIL